MPTEGQATRRGRWELLHWTGSAPLVRGRQGWVGGLCSLAAPMPTGSHPLDAGHRGSLGLTGVVASGRWQGDP